MAVSKVELKLVLVVCSIVCVEEILNGILACRPYCRLESVVLPSIVAILCYCLNDCVTNLRRNLGDILNTEYVLSLFRSKIAACEACNY